MYNNNKADAIAAAIFNHSNLFFLGSGEVLPPVGLQWVADADPGPDPVADPDPDPGPDPGTDPDPGPDPGTVADPGPDPGTDPGTDPDPGPDPGTVKPGFDTALGIILQNNIFII